MGFPSRKIARLVQVIAVAAAGFVFSAAGNAQVPTSGNVFFGYSYYNTTPLTFAGTTDRGSLNGWEGSLEGKVFRWAGLVADFSEHYGSQTVPNPAGTCAIGVACSPLPVSTHVQNFLFGPRVSVNVGKFRPFGEVLFGVGHISANVGSSLPDNFEMPKDTTLATAVGGGVDYRIIRPIAVRFQGDYIQTRFFGTTQNNVRLSTGIVLRF
jgi:opacity protein-like surface antigen